MATLPTVAIHNPKNPAEQWIINQSDFNPLIHRLWRTESDQELPHERQKETSETHEEDPHQEGQILTAPRRGRPPKS